MFNDNTIAKMVMATIKKRIEEKQKIYDKGVKEIDDLMNKEIAIIEQSRIGKKVDLANGLVAEILGK